MVEYLKVRSRTYEVSEAKGVGGLLDPCDSARLFVFGLVTFTKGVGGLLDPCDSARLFVFGLVTFTFLFQESRSVAFGHPPELAISTLGFSFKDVFLPLGCNS